MKNIVLFFSFAFSSLCFSQNYWESTNLAGGYIYSLALDSKEQIYALSWTDGIFRSTNNGNNWTAITELSTFNYNTLAIDSNDNIFVGSSEGLFRSTNNGESWINIFTPSDPSVISTPSIVSLTISKNNKIYAGTNYGVFRSTDGGNSWTKTNNGLAFSVRSFASNSIGDIFACYNSEGGIFRSTDNGDHWIKIDSGLSNLGVVSVAVDLSDNVFVGTGSGGAGIYRSTDCGNSWRQVSNYLSVNTFAFNSSNRIFVGTWVGVFQSIDDGVTWTEINSGLTDLGIHSLVINKKQEIFSGTHYDGVFRSTNPTTSVKNKNNIIPFGYSLKQNYPNPFNPTTKIEFTIPYDNNVEIKVFNILGMEVATLLNEQMAAGYHQVEFSAGGESASGGNASSLASGIYFYKIVSGNYSEIKKMILLR